MLGKHLHIFITLTVITLAIAAVTPTASAQGAPDHIFRVDINNGSTNGDGTAWGASAFKFLQDALTVADGHVNHGHTVEIWVAAGTYLPDQGTGYTAGNRNHSFHLRTNVAIYGGFSGDGWETQLSDRNWETNVTILDGDLLGDDEEFDPPFAPLSYSDNSRTVVRSIGNNDTAILDGFTVRGGAGDVGPFQGAGIRIIGSHAVIRNCIVTENWTVPAGGTGGCGGASGAGIFIGVDFQHATGNPRIENCRIENNWSKGGNGAGIGIRGRDDGKAGSDAVLINCWITDNLADECGGGMLVDNQPDTAVVTLVNCEIKRNEPDGAATIRTIFGEDLVRLRLWNVLVVDNQGRGLNLYDGDVEIRNATFANNVASGSGNAIRTSDSTVDCRNSIVWNTLSLGSVFTGSGFTVSHSNIQGGHTGSGNINADPSYVDPQASNYRLQTISPSIGAGNDFHVPCDEFDIAPDIEPCDDETNCSDFDNRKHPIDLDGHLRIVSNCSKVDQGAYQSIPACPWDVNGDGIVDVLDLLILLDCWGPVGGPECEPPDFNSDGAIDVLDLLEMLDNWGPCPSGDHQGGGGTVPEQFQDCWDDYQVHGDPDRFLGCMDWVENMDFYLAP